MDIARRSVTVLSFRVLTVALSFGSTAVFAWQLGARALGSFFLFRALLELLWFASDLGIAGAAVKRLSERRHASRVLTTVFLLKLVPLTLLLGGLFLTRELVNGYLGASLALYLGPAIVLRTYADLSTRVVQAELQMFAFATLQFLETAVFAVTGLVLVFRGYGVVGLVAGFLASQAVVFLLAQFVQSTSFGRPSIEQLRSVVDYSKYNMLSKAGGRVYNWVDVLVIGVFLGQAPVGAYEVAWRVSKLIAVPSTAIGNVVFPSVSDLHHQSQFDEVRAAVSRAANLSLLLPIPAVFGIALFAEEILGLFFGPAFAFAWLVLVVLAFDKVLISIQIVFQQTLRGTDDIRFIALATIATAGLNLVLNTILVWQYGIIGAAVGTTGAAAIYTAVLYVRVERTVGLDVDHRVLAMNTVAAGVMAAVLLGLRRTVAVDSIPVLVALVGSGVVVYVVTALGYRPLRDQLRRYVKDIT